MSVSSTLVEGKSLPRVELHEGVKDSDTCWSLLRYGNNYDRKKFYDPGPWVGFDKFSADSADAIKRFCREFDSRKHLHPSLIFEIKGNAQFGVLLGQVGCYACPQRMISVAMFWNSQTSQLILSENVFKVLKFDHRAQ